MVKKSIFSKLQKMSGINPRIHLKTVWSDSEWFWGSKRPKMAQKWPKMAKMAIWAIFGLFWTFCGPRLAKMVKKSIFSKIQKMSKIVLRIHLKTVWSDSEWFWGSKNVFSQYFTILNNLCRAGK